jgi:cytochrome c55X
MPKRQTQQKKYINGILFCLISLFMLQSVYGADEPLSLQRQAELQNLLLQDCGSCHGMTLKGGLGPALTPEVLKLKSRELIEVTILDGRKGTPMPPWKNILTQNEVRWLVDTLYAGVTP